MTVKYFNPGRVFSHNCIFNVVVSARGAGKTYSTFKYVLNNFFKKGQQFVYVRRTEKEMSRVRDNLFDAVMYDCFPDYRIEVVGDKLIAKSVENKSDVGVICGYIMPLSLSNQYKSGSYPKVTTVIYDEYINESGKYLKDEPEKLINLLETIFRTRQCRCILLGNESTAYNPFHLSLGIPPHVDEWKDKKRKIYFLRFTSESYSEFKKSTDFARLIEGTRYGDFILDNSNILDSEEAVRKIKGKKEIKCTFMLEGGIYGLYMMYDGRNTSAYIERWEKEHNRHFNLDRVFRENTFNVAKNNHIVKILSQRSREGLIFFDSVPTKMVCQSLLFKT